MLPKATQKSQYKMLQLSKIITALKTHGMISLIPMSAAFFIYYDWSKTQAMKARKAQDGTVPIDWKH